MQLRRSYEVGSVCLRRLSVSVRGMGILLSVLSGMFLLQRTLRGEEPTPTCLEVHSIPEGATVFVDGRKLGTAPLRYGCREVPASLKVSLELDRYEPRERTLRRAEMRRSARLYLSMNPVAVPELEPAPPLPPPLPPANRVASGGKQPAADGPIGGPSSLPSPPEPLVVAKLPPPSAPKPPELSKPTPEARNDKPPEIKPPEKKLPEKKPPESGKGSEGQLELALAGKLPYEEGAALQRELVAKKDWDNVIRVARVQLEHSSGMASGWDAYLLAEALFQRGGAGDSARCQESARKALKSGRLSRCDSWRCKLLEVACLDRELRSPRRNSAGEQALRERVIALENELMAIVPEEDLAGRPLEQACHSEVATSLRHLEQARPGLKP